MMSNEGQRRQEGGRYAEPWVPVQEGRERQLASLDRGNSAGRRLPAWGFPHWKFIEIMGVRKIVKVFNRELKWRREMG